MEFRVLGPLEVVGGGAPVSLGGPKQRTVLAALVLRANQPIPTAALVEAAWGDAAPKSAGAVIRTYVSRLRQALTAEGCDGGARVVGRPPGYVLEIEPGQVDAHRFEQLVGRAGRAQAVGRPAQAAAALDEALALWRGDVLADLAGVDAFGPDRARLGHMRLAAVEDRLDAELALGHHAEAVGELELLTREHPLRERFWHQLIVALYRSGRQADALAAYQAVRVTLVDQMGLEPSPDLQALERQVLTQADELRWRSPPGDLPPAEPANTPEPAATIHTPTGSWPASRTRFFGREAEIEELRRLLHEERLVTLVGAPGCGKSRLAVEAGSGSAADAPGGLWFVDLAAVSDPRALPSAVGRALGAREEPGRPIEDTLVEALGAAAPHLVVLDNCEHVCGAAGELVELVLARCLSTRILATSRSPLGLAGERIQTVPPLGLPAAVQLFRDRATLARGGLPPTRLVDGAVEQICDRLDRLPLAIELCSGWTRVLSATQIADRLANVLPLLTSLSPARGGARRGGRDRHDAMASAVDWSYRLLPADAGRLFVRLAVFAGGFDLEAAEAVGCSGDGDVLTRLAVLIDHSLVSADTSSPGPARYRMLEPVRQCAATVLGAGDDHPAVHLRHAEHYLALARRFDLWGLRRADRPITARRLEQDEPNLLAALSWSAAERTDIGLALAEALASFWEVSGRVNSGRAWLERMLALDTGDSRLRATALGWTGRLAWRQGDYRAARRLLDDGLDVVGSLDDPVSESLLRRILASVTFSDGDGETAARLSQESIDLCRAAGDEVGLIWSRFTLGWTHYCAGDVTSGDEQMHLALAANRAVGNATVTAQVLFGLHYGAFLAGDTGAQRAHLLGALAAVRDADGYLDEADWLWCAAVLAATEGRCETALRLVGGARSVSRRTGSRHPPQIEASMMAPFERVGAEVSPSRAEALLADGDRSSWDELVAEAIAEPAA